MAPARRKLRPVRPPLDWMLLPNLLAYLTAWYGLFVGKFPVQVLSAALGLGVIFSAGFYRIKIDAVKAEDYLPTNSPSINERRATLLFKTSEPHSPSQYPFILYNKPYNKARARRAVPSEYSLNPATFAESCRPNVVLLVAKVNESSPNATTYNLFSEEGFAEIERLERLIYALEVPARKNGSLVKFHFEPTFEDDYDNGLCTRQPMGQCAGFSIRLLRQFFDAEYDYANDYDPLSVFFAGMPGIGIKYPEFLFNDYSKYFSSVETDEQGFIKRVGAVREIYCLNEFFFDIFKASNKLWEKWEEQFVEMLRTTNFTSPYFDFYWMANFQRGGEQTSLVNSMFPKLVATFIALMLWCSVGALMRDAVRSKPWTGVLGVFATLFACSSGFGICLWAEPRFNPILMAVPLLVLAIGLDDMFIALEAWSRSNPTLAVEDRMMVSMHIGGTTIFITFLINLIDFVIGNYTPFPIINRISIYAIAAMVFDFVFQLTIFAPCLAIWGYIEQQGRHSCCCCLKVPHREFSSNASTLRQICCAGGGQVGKVRLRGIFLDQLANWLTQMPVRVVAVVAFFAYIALCGWSISQLDVGLKPERVYRRSSNMYRYSQIDMAHFKEFADEVTVVINNEVDYSLQAKRDKLIDLLHRLHSTGYFWPSRSKCWVTDFDKWIQANNISLGNASDVVSHLQRFPGGFLDSYDPETRRSYRSFSKDIRIDLNATRVLKTQCKIRAKDMSGPSRQIGMIESLRSISRAFEPEFEMYAFGDNFLLYDNFLTAVPTTLYYCGITLGATVGVAIFLIPHPACLFWVAVFVTSVLAGIVGLMRVWDMDLDSITLINLLIAISFCSDLIAHPLHVFLVSHVPRHSELTAAQARLVKTRALIEEVALAAVPACIGTVLSVVAMSTSDAYIFTTFFRMLFLSVLLSILHALVFVPAFLSFFGPSNPGIPEIGDARTTKRRWFSNVGSYTEEDFESLRAIIPNDPDSKIEETALS